VALPTKGEDDAKDGVETLLCWFCVMTVELVVETVDVAEGIDTLPTVLLVAEGIDTLPTVLLVAVVMATVLLEALLLEAVPLEAGVTVFS
jgi:hypothetical protein